MWKAYAVKEAFCTVMAISEKAEARRTLQAWLEVIRCADIKEFEALQKSFRRWLKAKQKAFSL